MQRSHLVPKYGTRWALMWTNSFLKHTHARIRVRFRCPGTRHKSGHRAPVCIRLYNHCKAHVLFLKLRLTGGKWSNYVHGYSRCELDTTLGRYEGTDSWSMWTAPEKWNRTFAYHVKGYKFCLIGLLWVFRCRYLLKVLNAMGRGGGGAPDFKWRGWLKDFWGVEIFDSGIFLVSISFTWGFFAFSKQSEVIDETEEVLGCLFFFGGGGLIFVPIRSFCHLKSGGNPPSPRAWELGAKKRAATFPITQLGFAHVRQ